MADHESMNGLHESHDLFKREHDEQLVQWMNRRPDDWTLSAGGSGTIYGWGHNHRGQLGGIEGAKVKVPTPTEALATLRPVQLIGGEQTLFAVTADGKVNPDFHFTCRSVFLRRSGSFWGIFQWGKFNVSFFKAVRNRIWSWGQTGHWWNGVCVLTDATGVDPTRLHPESGCELRGKTLSGSVLRRRGVFMGRGRRWKTGPWEQEVSEDLAY